MPNQFDLEPLRIFLTGNAGCGKTFLTKVMYQALAKTFSYQSRLVEKPKVLLMAPTSVAVINIESATVHSTVNIPVGCFNKNLTPLTDRIKSSLRNRLPDLKAIIIDKVSMV